MKSLLSFLLIAAAALLQPALLVAQPAAYSGSYGGALVWEGTVVMNGDVLIRKGGQLTIRPGTEVRVVPAEATKIDPEYLSSLTELLVRGRLDVEGTEQQPVRFVIENKPGGDEIAWAGITLDGAEPSAIRYVEISRAEIGIRCVGTAPLIEHNRLSRCRYGIVAQQGSHPKILDNRLEDGEGGIFCWRGSNPYLKGNTILNHDEEAVFVDADSRPWLDRNTLRGNAVGLAMTPRDLPFDEVEVQGNGTDVLWLATPDQGAGQP